jgi:hypothetical protein
MDQRQLPSPLLKGGGSIMAGGKKKKKSKPKVPGY